MTTDTDEKPTPPGADATIQDLLRWANVNGYADLTDNQIDQIVQYRAAVIAQGEQLKSMAEQQTQLAQQIIQQNAQVAANMQSALYEALKLRPAFEVVSTDE